MVHLRHLRELHLGPREPGGPHAVAAASGLVALGARLYVVFDDEPGLGVFGRDDPAHGRLLPLGGIDLSDDPAERKAAKPDLESLALLPASAAWPDGALLALGSGSTDRRERGWLWPLAGEEAAAGTVELSLSALYDVLRRELADLNVEGAAVAGDRLWLAQRGNGPAGENALVELDLAAALERLTRDRELTAETLRGIHRHELGEVHGVELAFSDLSPLPDGRLAFSAAAEAGASTYHDGPCVGAAVGVVDPGSEPARLVALSEPWKVEGLDVTRASEGTLELLLVADPDDPDRPSPVFAARAPLG